MVDPTPLPRPEPALAFRGLTAGYGDRRVLDGIDLRIAGSAMTAIVGPNGAGKSTLLKAALGLIPATGEVRLLGQPRDQALPRVAYVPQRAGVAWDFPARVRDVVAMGLFRETGLFGRLTPALRARVDLALARVGLSDLADRQIGALSGGQQQRTFIARALVQTPQLYLLDEPFAGVDAATEDAILTLLRALLDEGATVVAVHHDLATVRGRFDRAVLVGSGGVTEGPIATVLTPASVDAAYAAPRALA
jgi:manganese/zinc/iron transport system ATP- binding protein